MNKILIIFIFNLIICNICLYSQDISKKSFTTRVINENFNEKTDVFEIMTDMDNYFIIDNGDYLLSRNNEKTEYAIIAQEIECSNFILETSIRIGPSKNNNASLGIILKAQENGNGAIIFEINRKNQYRIKKYSDKKYDILSGDKKNNGWIKNSIINEGDKKNIIEIRSEKNLYEIYINRNYITSFFIDDFNKGYSGIIITPLTKARIDYFYLNTDENKYANLNPNLEYQSNLKINNLNAVIIEKNDSLKLFKKNNLQLSNKLDSVNKKIINIDNDLKKVSSLNKEITNLNKLLKRSQEKNLKAENENIELTNQILSKSNTIKEKDKLINKLDKSIELVESKLNKEKSKLQKLKEKNSKDRNTQKEKIKKLELDISNLKAKNNSYKKEKANLLDKISRLEKKYNNTSSKLSQAQKKLIKLQEVQEKHDAVTKQLSNNNSMLVSELEKREKTIKNEKEKNNQLNLENLDLKKLFVMKDFEVNGVNIDTEKIKETKIVRYSPQTTFINTEKKTIYSVQVGVYLNKIDNQSFIFPEQIWSEKTKKGTYIYLSGKFNTLDEAIKHQKILYMSGLKECFVVLINN